ncbi:MAG: PadR family transcriptional regulator [Hyphomicrobium sp.]|jgi:PadR family transcriptional regulator PadR
MAETWISQMRKGFVEFCILAVVRSGADYGYLIYKKLNETNALAFTESTVYPAINRLMREGMLSSFKSAARSEGPPRRYYVLAEEGRIRLANMEAYWGALKQDVDALLKPKEQGRS